VTFRERCQERLSLALWRMQRNREKAASAIVWPPQSAHPSSIVVLLPEKFDQFDLARRVLEDIHRKLDPQVFIICLRENYRSWVQAAPDVHLMTFDDRHKNLLGLPRTEFIERLKKTNPDMVISLMPSYDPFMSHLAVKCGARLRLSLDYPDAGLFHNLLITPEGHKPLSERYKTLVNYL